jgi:hypothetical protein
LNPRPSVPQAVPPLSGCVLSAGYDRLTRPYSACSGVFGTLCATDCATSLKPHLKWVVFRPAFIPTIRLTQFCWLFSRSIWTQRWTQRSQPDSHEEGHAACNSEGCVPSFFRTGDDILNRRGEQSLADYASNHANDDEHDWRKKQEVNILQTQRQAGKQEQNVGNRSPPLGVRFGHHELVPATRTIERLGYICPSVFKPCPAIRTLWQFGAYGRLVGRC